MNEPKHIKHTMRQELLFAGLDVHAKNITVALAEGGGGEARLYGTTPNDLHALEKVFAKLRGPSGDRTARLLRGGADRLRPRAAARATQDPLHRRRPLADPQPLRGPGEDRLARCAEPSGARQPKGGAFARREPPEGGSNLVRLDRAGELTAVHVPDANHQALRGIESRARSLRFGGGKPPRAAIFNKHRVVLRERPACVLARKLRAGLRGAALLTESSNGSIACLPMT